MHLVHCAPYIIALLFILLPGILLGFQERSLNFYGLAGSFLILLILFGSRPVQFFYLAFSALWHLLLFFGADILWQKHLYSQRLAGLFLLLALVPLFPKNYYLCQGLKVLPVFLAVTVFSLKSIQMLTAIYRGEARTISLGEYAGFLLFFPSLLAGPINTIADFHQTWKDIPPRDKYKALAKSSLLKFVQGGIYLFLGTALLSNPLHQLEEEILAGSISSYWLIVYGYLYSIRLFFRLAGFSQTASGCAALLGINLNQNYSFPFFACSIEEFWRRWHMTFTSWLEEFICRPFLKMTKGLAGHPLLRQWLGCLAAMGALGFFYGTTPSFLLFALYHSLLLWGSQLLKKKSSVYTKIKTRRSFQIFSWFLTLQFIIFGFFILSGMFLKMLSL